MIVVAMKQERKLVDFSKDNKFIITGVGINVIKALMPLDRDTPIHNIGYAGSNCLPIGTKVNIGMVQMYHPNVDYKETIYNLSGDIPCYTSSDFVTKTDIKEPCVFDMERAYILAMGFTNVTAEKIVSDNLSVKEFENYDKTRGD